MSHSQTIGNVVTENQSRAFVGNAGGNVSLGDIHFEVYNKEDPREKFTDSIRKCRNALFRSYPRDDRAELISAKGRRVKGTCEWIESDPTFKTWLEGDEPLLWICGGPGKGKTMLSIYLTQQLEKKHGQVIYFFCMNGNANRNSATAVMRSLLWQITEKQPALSHHLLDDLSSEERQQTTLGSIEALWRLFEAIISDPDCNSIICVVDGLDECDEDSIQQLATKIVDLAEEDSQNTCRTIVVSRDILTLDRSVATRIQLDPDHNRQIASDIEKFVAIRVEELMRVKRLPGYDDGLRQKVKSTLLEKAEGTFLWVGFAMIELHKKTGRKQVEHALKTLPRGLPLIYDRMLEQIEEQHLEVVSRILKWVTLAPRQLRLYELEYATHSVAQSVGVEYYVEICRPFLEIAQHHDESCETSDSDFTKSNDSPMVRLVHQSAKDYLLDNDRDGPVKIRTLIIDAQQAHFELAWSCLDYLVEDMCESRKRENEVSHPMFEYAIMYWPLHASAASGLAGKLMEHPSNFFGVVNPAGDLERSALFPYFYDNSFIRYDGYKVAHEKCGFNRFEKRSAPVFQFICSMGWVSLADAVLNYQVRKGSLERTVVNRPDELGILPLFCAVLGDDRSETTGFSGNCKAVVQMLLHHGADVNARHAAGMTPLLLAVTQQWRMYRPSEDIVEILLSHRANVNVQDADGRTPLHLAGNSEEMVRTLLDHGANVNARDRCGNTPLLGRDMPPKIVRFPNREVPSTKVVEMLLKHGANINAANEDGITLLHVAASHRGTAESLMKILLEQGANINATDNSGATPLHLAIIDHHYTAVKILVEHGADLSVETNQ